MKSVELTMAFTGYRFVDEIEVIDSRISSWHEDEGIKANMAAVDQVTKRHACQ
jgi:hypothetical protein